MLQTVESLICCSLLPREIFYKTRKVTRLKFCIKNAFMAILMIHAKFHFNRLMLTLLFGIWASEHPPPPPPLGPGERMKRPGLIGLRARNYCIVMIIKTSCNYTQFVIYKECFSFENCSNILQSLSGDLHSRCRKTCCLFRFVICMPTLINSDSRG